MKSNFIFYILLFCLGVFITACDDNDPQPENPEELITTVRLDFVAEGTTEVIRQEFKDLDGDGGDDPVITTNPLDSSKTYSVTVTFLNEQKDPAEDITEEVKEEDEEHQVFYIISGLNLTHEYQDSDPSGNPLGVENSMVSGDLSTGTLTVILRHEPDKNAAGVSDGDITNAGGETDVEVTFDLEIK